jgi:hypothetical protein
MICGASSMSGRPRIAHFYHVFADGDWQSAAVEHVGRLAASGLLRELDGMYLGVVGSAAARAEVAHRLPGVIVAEAESGWEQVTLEALRRFVEDFDGYVFYAHTKGAWSQTPLAVRWRELMTAHTVDAWEKCVRSLEAAEVVGPFWFRSRDPEHALHEHFFAGNFWWARSEYLASLGPVRTSSRFDAEGWVGLGRPSAVDLTAGMVGPWEGGW